VRPALILLLVGTAVAYLWNLSASGYANSFYAAAVQAATKSWKAFLFGSIDSSNFITVDKPPASLWVMALSGRLFGFSGLSVLVPQVLEGVVSVGLLYAAVKRWFGGGAALLAGLVLALTPVAALMFRFNNPDALLVCLLTASAYCLVRALESGSTRWMIGVGTLIGFGFLTKMGQAFLVLPGFALVYLVAAPVTLRRRLGQLLAGGAALLVSAGWWVVLVTLWPVASRPMIDGSSDNSILNLIVGYNGLGRIFGGGGGPGGGGAPGGGGGGGGGFGGEPGVLRLFNSLMGGQASWLIPAALGVLVLGLWSTRRAPRTDRHRAALLLWGSWLLVSAAVFSLSSGIIHTYYTVALAPAIAALVGVGAAWLWQCRGTVTARIGLVVGVASTAAWAWILLDRTPSWEPWLRTLIPVAAVMAVIILLGAPLLRRFSRPVAIAAATLCLVAGLGGPTAYAAQTIGAAHTGSVPSAGPSTGVGGGPGSASGSKAPTSSAGGVPSLFSPSGRQTGSVRAEGAPGRGAGLAGAGGAGGPGGGSSAQVSSALVKALKSGASSYRWVAATSGSQSAASLELASGGEPVMAIGGFSGQGGELTLTQFEHYVKAGQIHYYLASGGGPGGGSGSSSIVSWVEAHYKAETISGQTIYDLTSPK
jgi:4-amino-4-deoxy-L-arabinose transferase-like glycosyltransferase